jgi:hypothetical protein
MLPAVALLCCTQSAAAGCGDYLTIIDPDGKIQSPVGHDNAPVKAPCHGPNCSASPKAPAPIPPSLTSPGPVVKAMVEVSREQPGSPGYDGLTPPTDGSPTRLTSSIFHPPRA